MNHEIFSLRSLLNAYEPHRSVCALFGCGFPLKRETFDRSDVLYAVSGTDVVVRCEMPRQVGEQGLHVPSHAQRSAHGLCFLPQGFSTTCLPLYPFLSACCATGLALGLCSYGLGQILPPPCRHPPTHCKFLGMVLLLRLTCSSVWGWPAGSAPLRDLSEPSVYVRMARSRVCLLTSTDFQKSDLKCLLT